MDFLKPNLVVLFTLSETFNELWWNLKLWFLNSHCTLKGTTRQQATFLTRMPRSYTSLQLDGEARNFHSCYLHRYGRSRNLLCLDPFIFRTSYAEKRKPFGLSWNQTQVLLPHRQPLQPVDHASFDRMRLSVRLFYSNTYIARWTMTALWHFFATRDFQLCIFTVSKNTSHQSLSMMNSFGKKNFSIFLFLILFIDPIKSLRTLWTVKLEFIFCT